MTAVKTRIYVHNKLCFVMLKVKKEYLSTNNILQVVIIGYFYNIRTNI